MEMCADDLGRARANAALVVHFAYHHSCALVLHEGTNCSSSTIAPVSNSVRIGILGDFNPEFRSHHATNDCLQHAARKLKLQVESVWLPTPSLLEPAAAATLDSFDGLWASPGSPYKSFDGMLKGIRS